MQIKRTGHNQYQVSISERNLGQLEQLWASAILGEAVPALHRRQEDGIVLSIIVEDDTTHYKNRTGGGL